LAWIKSDRVRPDTVWPTRVMYDEIRSDRVESAIVRFDRVRLDLVRLCQVVKRIAELMFLVYLRETLSFIQLR